jgi:hypothetical protein
MALPEHSVKTQAFGALSIGCPVAALLLAAAPSAHAQMAAPACGYAFGAWITPENSPVLGCSVPDAAGDYGTVLRVDQFSPGGIRAEPAAPAPLPVFTPGSRGF